MVLVEDVTSNSGNSASSSSSTSAPRQDSSPSDSGSTNRQQTTIGYILGDKISAVLFLTRFFTFMCTFLFVFPFSGYDQNTLYQKALMSSAATSALKLHQRVSGTQFQLNRAYFNTLMIEDSFHYLMFALIFLNAQPITVVLMPITAFAVLHICAYLRNITNVTGTSFGPLKKLVDLVCSKDKDIMRFVAVNEIVLGPTIVFMIFTGKCGIFVPFIYYRFICMRYQSRRNPYNRQMFYELRVSTEYYSSQPNCPGIVRNVCAKIVALVTRLAPPQAA